MSKYTDLAEELRVVEDKILNAIHDEINDSKLISKDYGTKAIPVNFRDYKEIIISQGRLTFIDNGGYQHSLWSETTLDDLVDILNELE